MTITEGNYPTAGVISPYGSWYSRTIAASFRDGQRFGVDCTPNRFALDADKNRTQIEAGEWLPVHGGQFDPNERAGASNVRADESSYLSAVAHSDILHVCLVEQMACSSSRRHLRVLGSTACNSPKRLRKFEMAERRNHVCQMVSEEADESSVSVRFFDWIAFVGRVTHSDPWFCWPTGSHAPACGDRDPLGRDAASAYDHVHTVGLSPCPVKSACRPRRVMTSLRLCNCQIGQRRIAGNPVGKITGALFDDVYLTHAIKGYALGPYVEEYG